MKSKNIKLYFLKKILITFLFALFFVVLSFPLLSQTWEWAAITESKSIIPCTFDNEGNSYSYNYYSCFISAVNKKDTFTASSIFKIDKNGNITISRKLNYIPDDTAIFYIGEILTTSNFIFINLTMSGSLQIADSIIKTNVPKGKKEVILLKLDKELNYLENIRISKLNDKKTNSILIYDIFVDRENNYIFAGASDDSFTFLNTKISLNNKSGNFNFIMKTDLKNVKWVRTYFKPFINKTSDKLLMDYDSNFLFIDYIKLATPDNFDSCKIIKISPDNRIIAQTSIKVLHIEGKCTLFPFNFYLDSLNNVYFTGDVTCLNIFPNGITIMKNDSLIQHFIAKFDKNLYLIKLLIFTGKLNHGPPFFIPASRNRFYLVMSRNSDIEFNNYHFIYNNKPSYLFLILDSMFNVKWFDNIPGGENSPFPLDAIIDYEQNLYVYGTYKSIDFDKYHLKRHIQNYYSIFIVKLNPDSLRFQYKPGCEADTLINISAAVYDSFTWLVGGLMYKTRPKEKLVIPKVQTPTPVLLTGYKIKGIQNVFRDTLYKAVNIIPEADFSLDTNTYCKWIKVKFFDKSKADTIHPVIGERWQWNFGDDSSSGLKNPMHIYAKDGLFSIKLIYYNGFCYDTMIKNEYIRIIDAPKPGFTLTNSEGCVPFKTKIINNAEGQYLKIEYILNDSVTFQTNEPDIQINSKGWYFIRQKVYGTTGCITEDSASFWIKPGYTGNEKAHIDYVSVLDTHAVVVRWKNDDIAQSGELIKFNETEGVSLINIPIDNTSDSLIDRLVNTTVNSYSYILINKDSCEKNNQASPKHQTILLTGKNYDNNYTVLQWNPYQGWINEPNYYILKLNDDNSFIESKEKSAGNIFTDYNFYRENSLYRIYRIKAVSEPNEYSYSNILKINYIPTLFFPNAFTPNDDNLNDSFIINPIGYKNYTVQIYNRWGEKIKTLQTGESWDFMINGKKCESGVYYFDFTGTDNADVIKHKRGTFQIIR